MKLVTEKLRNCEVVVDLTPSGLGRLAAVLGARKGENPYPPGTPQHAAWRENYADVESLESVDLRRVDADPPSPPPHHS